jgi:hypothetical protein
MTATLGSGSDRQGSRVMPRPVAHRTRRQSHQPSPLNTIPDITGKKGRVQSDDPVDCSGAWVAALHCQRRRVDSPCRHQLRRGNGRRPGTPRGGRATAPPRLARARHLTGTHPSLGRCTAMIADDYFHGTHHDVTGKPHLRRRGLMHRHGRCTAHRTPGRRRDVEDATSRAPCRPRYGDAKHRHPAVPRLLFASSPRCGPNPRPSRVADEHPCGVSRGDQGAPRAGGPPAGPPAPSMPSICHLPGGRGHAGRFRGGEAARVPDTGTKPSTSNRPPST